VGHDRRLGLVTRAWRGWEPETAVLPAMITVWERTCSKFKHFRSQTVMGVAPLEGVAAARALVTGGVAVVGGSPVRMSDAMKVTFGTLSVLKVTFMALTTTPLTHQPHQTRHPIKIDNSLQGSHTQQRS
jgi:hypothetical protein